MVRLVAIRMQTAGKAVQELACAFARPAGLVIIQHDRPSAVSRGPVNPYAALLPGCSSRLPQNHQRGFIRVQDFVCKQFLPQKLEEIRKPSLMGGKNPLRHGLARNRTPTR